jgi:predicted amidophosphoribosyltransferase
MPVLTEIAAAAVDLVLPRTCPGCAAPEPWCRRCAANLEGPPRSVLPSTAALDAAAGLPLPPLRALTRYRGAARAAVIAGKERNRTDLPPLLGRALGRGIRTLLRVDPPPGPLWLVPAPSRRAAGRARGGDPVAVMAVAAAGELASAGVPVGVAQPLATAGRARDAVGLSAGERVRNLRGRIRLDRRCLPPRGAGVLLLDDVITSGATAVAALQEWRRAGLAAMWGVLAVTAAAPWADEKNV